MRGFLHWLSGFLHVKVYYAQPVDDTDQDAAWEPLFERYYLATIGRWTIYLHHYLRSDPDRGVHDHPYGMSFAIPLAGFYGELRLLGFYPPGGPIIGYTERRALRPYRLSGTDFHSLRLIPGKTTWSLFIHKPFSKGWGFLRDVDRSQWTGAAIPTVAYFPAKEQELMGVGETIAKWRSRPRGRHVERAAA
jgi:hypothetical protein